MQRVESHDCAGNNSKFKRFYQKHLQIYSQGYIIKSSNEIVFFIKIDMINFTTTY